MKPRGLLSAIFSTAAVLIAGSMLATYWIGLAAIQAEKRMAGQLQALKQVSNVGSTLKDTETGQRGYLLTGNERYLEPYNSALSLLREQLAGLQKLAAAGDLPKNKVEDVIGLSKQKLDELDQTIRLRKEKGLEAALAVVRTDRGKRIMDQMRSDLAEMQSQAQTEFDAASRRAAWTGTVRTIVFVVIGILNLFFLVWAYQRISSEIERREAANLERKRAEEARAQLARIVESSDDAIISKTLDGIITSWNHSAERLFSYSAEEAIGKPMSMVFPPDRLNEESDFLAKIARGESIDHFETVRVRKDGMPIDVSVTLSPMRDSQGKIVGASKIARDVSERKLADRKLHAQLGRLELLDRITRAVGERQDLQSIFQVVIRTLEVDLPLDFCCVCLYDGTANLLTVTAVGVRSKELALELAMTEQAHIPIDENGLSRCVRGQLVYEPDISQVKFPFPQRLAGGGLRSLVAAPLLVESTVFGIVVAARREAGGFSSGECEFLRQLSGHVALAAHQAQLYGALQQAYNDLRQTQQTVMQQERLRALGQMASGIAHDINNAISPVAMYTESLLETESSLSARARNYLETIQRAIEDVAATVSRMREFYRHREPQMSLARVDLNQLIQQVADMTRARWSDMPHQRGVSIKFQTELAAELPFIMGVESEIREALINLVFNAVDAMPNGGALTLRTKVVEVAPVSVESPAVRNVQVEVADTGIGMDEETRRRCLEPFFTTKGERGTGLGLAMVYGVVQRHSADIEIESAPGKGTTMRLSFAVPVNIYPGLAPSSTAQVVPSRLSILVVDDDPILLKSLRDILEADGHLVVAMNSGREGIEAFLAAQKRGERFAVVITDLGMPDIDGRKVASSIKAASSDTPIILLTGWGQRLVAEGDVPPHVDHVLGKPPKLRELREALAHCCPVAQS